MTILILGLLVFTGIHLLREFGLQEGLRQRLGIPVYKLLYSLAALVGIFLIVEGKSMAPFVQLWVPPYNLRSLTHLLMISATILFFAGNLPYSYTRRMVIHPMLIGVIIWGVAHLISNGDLASALIFATLPVWAIIKIISLEHHNKTLPPPSTPVRPSLQWDAAAIIIGVIAYGLFLVFHGQLFGFALVSPA